MDNNEILRILSDCGFDSKTRDRILHLCTIARDIQRLYDREMAHKPYHINLLDLIHANENAHTRILTALLAYARGGAYPILHSYVDLAFSIQGLTPVDIQSPVIAFNDDFIDCLLWEKGRYAIIIENKIHWAVDQDRQVERYIKTVIGRGIPVQNIYVVYLTSDGQKEVSDYSFTDEAKELIGDRFIRMNYRDHILPWLEDTVLPGCTIGEDYLVAAIKQYIDHLRGLFGKRQEQMDVLNRIEMKTQEALGIRSSSSLQEKFMELSALSDEMESYMNIVGKQREQLINPILNTIFFPQLRYRLQEKGLVLSDIAPDYDWMGTSWAGFRVNVPGWNSFDIAFEFENRGIGALIIGFLLKDGEKQRKDFPFWEELQNRIGASGRNNERWIYRSVPNDIRWWNSSSVFAMIFDGTLADRLVPEVCQFVSSAEGYAM